MMVFSMETSLGSSLEKCLVFLMDVETAHSMAVKTGTPLDLQMGLGTDSSTVYL